MIEFPGTANPARDDGPEPTTGHGYLAHSAQGSAPGVLVLHAW